MQFHQLKRRDFITLLASAAVASPLRARAQQTGKLPTIGLMGANNPSLESRWATTFVQRLRELGWIDGRTVAIEYRWASGAS
jgi:putative tryptophan/tyrosine transport system substrate-binding protein